MAVNLDKSPLADAAERICKELPAHRVEILNGCMSVTQPPGGPHQESLTWLVEKFFRAGARQAGLRYMQGIGLWLPTGPDDYAVPDFSVVHADYRDALVEKNRYAPHVFRLVLEVTSSYRTYDTATKVDAYARADVPAYIIVDRTHDEALLHTDPADGKYPDPQRFKRGQSVPVPESVGITLDLSVATLLDGDGDGDG
ncbi:Uma2 family endonuclease [Streptomyces sp. M2CJ-2]|uniref:Uma2 family endonuclease n=1 Tax=Streptomyces sp. M2CJ-2 TaxID=2803948 RepID=UPI001927AD17|nr:Uma2 family endonuclease [Streptomyces sp. M2CJ-2]MBL3667890.1 Uma2 family endonuclease [Streptomyces sp. M2CJ-2]